MREPEHRDVKDAADRLAGVIRPLTVVPADAAAVPGVRVHLALEFLQHSGSFKARAAANLTAALLEAGAMPAAGMVTSTGRNADLGAAWAGQRFGVPVTSFLARDAAPVMVERLRGFGADMRVGGASQAEAQRAAAEFAARTGAVDAYTHDEGLTSAGAGTILLELVQAVPDLDTVVVAVGAGGMFSGVTAAADAHGVRVVGAEPEGSRALRAALDAQEVRDVDVETIAADSLGAPRVSAAALAWARSADIRSVVVDDAAIVAARRFLWERHRLVVEHGSATALAVLREGAYRPEPGERVGVVLCGANTDPADLGR
ncbi:threonine dehydratase [Catenulispora sp. GP43]|uniref:pyridoxal-phosphate dependent enzyme n=1 Tax=Catenulispora sp. GP43 TaxID=3156263 RepID=UPI003515E8D4